MIASSSSILKKTLLLVLIIATLYFGKEFLMPLAIGGILSTLFLPLCSWLEKKKLPKGLAVFICLLSLFLIMSSLVLLLGWKIASLLNDIDLLKQKTIESLGFIQAYIFNHSGITIEEQSQFLKTEQPSFKSIMQLTVGSLFYIFTNFVLAFILQDFIIYYFIFGVEIISKTMPSFFNSLRNFSIVSQFELIASPISEAVFGPFLNWERISDFISAGVFFILAIPKGFSKLLSPKRVPFLKSDEKVLPIFCFDGSLHICLHPIQSSFLRQ
jgi:predicted PurR-regulated permease PerM